MRCSSGCTAMRKVADRSVRGFGWEKSHAAVSPFRDTHRFPSARVKPVLTCTRTPRTFGILSLVQGAVSVAPSRSPVLTIRNFFPSLSPSRRTPRLRLSLAVLGRFRSVWTSGSVSIRSRDEADAAHRQFAVGQSDHLTQLRAYMEWDSLAGPDKFSFCRNNFLGIKTLQVRRRRERSRGTHTIQRWERGDRNNRGFGSGGDRNCSFGRGANPKLSRRTCTCENGLQSCRGKSAGVAKRPREPGESPIRNPYRYDSQLFRRCELSLNSHPYLSANSRRSSMNLLVVLVALFPLPGWRPVGPRPS
jgi:hypothetical protein